MASILRDPSIEVSYADLPPLPACASGDASIENWPFGQLPSFAHVYGSALGQLPDYKRAVRKENQLKSMLRCIFAVSAENDVIVDFGGGTGHLAIPLALLRPHCTIIVVDLHEKSLEILHSKIQDLSLPERMQSASSHSSPVLDKRLRQCTSLPNLFTFSGPLQFFDSPFDVGVALHLCGESTDVALQKCVAVQAKALVFAPCCVGKLNKNVKNPYIWQSTGSNIPTVQYPQSKVFKKLITNESDWNALAKAADYGEILEFRTPRNAVRRTAKTLLETDRRLFLEQEHGYQTALIRMEPWESTPKNDIILAWSPDSGVSFLPKQNQESMMDIRRSKEYLFCQPAEPGCQNQGNNDKTDWTAQEEANVREIIQNFLHSSEKRFVFPIGMGPRRRKLVHYLAEQMFLEHWGQGKGGNKTVVIEKPKEKLAA